MAWYFQTSPHDTHDWDSAQVPVLIDGQIDGRPRKLVAQAARNGYYFLIDRTNGQSVLTVPYVDFMNWSLGVNAKGQPINNPAKDATRRRRAGLARLGDQLAAAELQSRRPGCSTSGRRSRTRCST